MVKERRETCWELGDQEVWGRGRGRCPRQDADCEDICILGGCRQDPSPAEAALNNQTDTGPALYRSGPLARWPMCAVIMVGGTEARLRPLHPPPPPELIGGLTCQQPRPVLGPQNGSITWAGQPSGGTLTTLSGPSWRGQEFPPSRWNRYGFWMQTGFPCPPSFPAGLSTELGSTFLTIMVSHTTALLSKELILEQKKLNGGLMPMEFPGLTYAPSPRSAHLIATGPLRTWSEHHLGVTPWKFEVLAHRFK